MTAQFNEEECNQLALMAVSSEHLVGKLLALGANNYLEVAKRAVAEGYVDTLKLVIDRVLDQVNELALISLKKSHVEVTELLLEYKPTNIVELLEIAIKRGYETIVEKLLGLGTIDSTDLDRLVWLAIKNRESSIVSLLLDQPCSFNQLSQQLKEQIFACVTDDKSLTRIAYLLLDYPDLVIEAAKCGADVNLLHRRATELGKIELAMQLRKISPEDPFKRVGDMLKNCNITTLANAVKMFTEELEDVLLKK